MVAPLPVWLAPHWQLPFPPIQAPRAQDSFSLMKPAKDLEMVSAARYPSRQRMLQRPNRLSSAFDGRPRPEMAQAHPRPTSPKLTTADAAIGNMDPIGQVQVEHFFKDYMEWKQDWDICSIHNIYI